MIGEFLVLRAVCYTEDMKGKIYKKKYEKYITATRKPAYPIHPAILNRHSPRVLRDEEEPVTDGEFLTLIEAARWAPSSSNSQPWRFIVGKKGAQSYEKLRSLLDEFNTKWTAPASYLLLLISDEQPTTPKGKVMANRNHTSDAGAAWENLAIQASDMDIVAHGMAGYDHERARELFKIPEQFRVEFMIAIGRRTSLTEVPPEFLSGETPNTRKPIEELLFDGEFGKPYLS